MVVVAIRLRNNEVGTTCYLDRVNQALVPAVSALSMIPVHCRGHGDLVLIDEQGITRKVLGASLRQTSRLVLYLGVFLVDNAVPLMERYLATPSREPSYRFGRGHGDFCTHLSTLSLTTHELIDSIQTHAQRLLGDHALP
jgi:lipoate-protein ligase A